MGESQWHHQGGPSELKAWEAGDGAILVMVSLACPPTPNPFQAMPLQEQGYMAALVPQDWGQA